MIDYRFRAKSLSNAPSWTKSNSNICTAKGDSFHFMNTKTYEQMEMSRDELAKPLFIWCPTPW